MNKKFEESLVNVNDFGAVGDGITDDEKAIQSAINYAISNGKNKIYFPNEKYKYTNFVISKSIQNL